MKNISKEILDKEPSNDESVPERKHGFSLSCKTPFRNYCVGDIVKDFDEIEKILSSDEKNLVLKFKG